MLEAIAIYLLCAGGGPLQAVDSPYTRDAYGTLIGSSLFGRVGERAVAAEVEIVGNQGRVRIPDGLRPSLSSGGDGGWWKLRNLDVRRDEIRGHISLSPINRPKLRIDRRNGRIAIGGGNGGFQGRCEPFDPRAVRRQF